MAERRRHAETALLLWGPRVRPARGPKPTLDLDRIARAGIEIADAEGLAELSMQRVAAQLGVTKMALYRYVPGKAELIALMVDAAIGPYPEPEPERAEPGQVESGQAESARGESAWVASGQAAADDGRPGGDWREQLEDWARRLITLFLRHPWALEATVGPRLMGPAELSWLERAVAALEGTGLTGAERMDAAVLLVGHVRSIAQQAHAAGPAGDPEAQLGPLLAEVMREHGERFPALSEAIASAARPGAGDQAWEFGLQRILDGLAVLIHQRTTP
ncbi:TetR/AcrR family transcriptional regulator [Allostreptomyces psammosilenae]|uniref:AcrR family transcriptional regulator n=1 Tax=Allostreptomyces psammosilenae TaxID=1892865 RepID=A0A853A2M9_9ACTN|nr:TetR/AcrR family transcriptional regulator [Allostreptomyces psammosilenae]NYI07720.1 AcrR family transcriptional regulator [Allostreptomyces psammosilenae]